jgi:hypothetical protein
MVLLPFLSVEILATLFAFGFSICFAFRARLFPRFYLYRHFEPEVCLELAVVRRSLRPPICVGHVNRLDRSARHKSEKTLVCRRVFSAERPSHVRPCAELSFRDILAVPSNGRLVENRRPSHNGWFIDESQALMGTRTFYAAGRRRRRESAVANIDSIKVVRSGNICSRFLRIRSSIKLEFALKPPC